jgi:hypothetical protein
MVRPTIWPFFANLSGHPALVSPLHSRHLFCTLSNAKDEEEDNVGIPEERKRFT